MLSNSDTMIPQKADLLSLTGNNGFFIIIKHYLKPWSMICLCVCSCCCF